jgi:hypothetical protein
VQTFLFAPEQNALNVCLYFSILKFPATMNANDKNKNKLDKAFLKIHLNINESEIIDIDNYLKLAIKGLSYETQIYRYIITLWLIIAYVLILLNQLEMEICVHMIIYMICYTVNMIKK